MSSRILKYLVLLAFILLMVSISSFWFGSPSFSARDVKLELEGPTQASAGDEVVYKLKYANATRSALHNLDFVFFYPGGSTVIRNGTVSDDLTDSFKVERLAPGQSGEKEFKAFLIGEKGNIKVAKIELSFKASNLTPSFDKSNSVSTTIVSAPISLTLVAPPSSVSGQGLTYMLDYRNESGADISDLILEFDYPDGFTPQEFAPQPDKGNNIWHSKILKNGHGSRISIKGFMGGREGENKVISVKLKRKIEDKYVDYQKASAVTVISSPILGAELMVNNSLAYSAHLGDKLNYKITYRNNSNLNLSNMNLAVKLEGDMFDFSTLDTKGGFFDDSTKTILWNESTLPEFRNFGSQQIGQANFSIALKSFFSSTMPGVSHGRFVKVSLKWSTPNVPEGIDSEEIAVSSSLVTKIETQPTLNQFGYYNDPDFGSSGPLPPRVGEETTLTIRWQLTNPGNTINNAKVGAKLSLGVIWADAAKASTEPVVPVFNPNSSELTWNISALPYGVGLLTPKYEASFRVKVKPASSQKGKVLNLFENVQLTGTDDFTRQSVIINGKNITTNDLVDRPREGTVQ